MPLDGFSWRTITMGATQWLGKSSRSLSDGGDLSPEAKSSISRARREGSPWHGLDVVFFREMSDHLTSVRMLVLELLVVLFGAVVVYFAAEQIRQTTAEDQFLFLRLFAPPGQSLLSFVVVLSILVPLMAIGLGFDAINGEHNRRTLSRILAQPIYRDALLLGEIPRRRLRPCRSASSSLWLMVIGFGLIRLGIPPNGEELGAFAGVPAADDLLRRRVARARHAVFDRVPLDCDRRAGDARHVAVPVDALAGAGASRSAEVISPSDIRFAMLGLPTPDTVRGRPSLARVSPSTLYGEAVVAMLNPTSGRSTNLLGADSRAG